jgi:ADP-ribosylation factor-like protein 8
MVSRESADYRDLRNIEGREVSCYSISAKEAMNLDAVFKWLVARYSVHVPC